jgi:23S rRNA (uracil1939-C5)-methyltransferase
MEIEKPHPIASSSDAPAAYKGDTATALIESLNHEGQGVARIDGKAVFIDGALPGETVLFLYHNKFKSYDTGRVLEVVRASPERVTPRCRHFGVCGGCSLQYMRPEAQLTAKQQILRDALRHIGKVVPENWLPPLTGPAWGYRRRARLGVRYVPKKGGVLVGFREKRRSFITPLLSCDVLDPAISALLPELRDLIAALSCPTQLPQIEVAVGENARALVFRHLAPLTEADVAVLRTFGEQHSLYIYAEPNKPEPIHALWPAHPEPLYYTLPEFDIRMEFNPTDFIQINAELNRAIVNIAIRLLAPQPDETVLDLFCGLGNFSLPLARRAGRVVGIEADAPLLEKARQAAVRNGLANVEFRAANLYDEQASTPWGDARFDKWLLDPPRTGAIEMLKRLPEAGAPQRILYISCNPATLARDSATLVHTKGYRLVSAGVADMFPHTNHVEALALFDRPNNP